MADNPISAPAVIDHHATIIMAELQQNSYYREYLLAWFASTKPSALRRDAG